MRKFTKAQKIAGIYNMPHTSKHIMSHIDEAVGLDVMDKVTSRQIADLIMVAQYCYHAGRQSTGAEVIDGDSVLINATGQLIPLSALRALKITECNESSPAHGQPAVGGGYAIRHYSLDHEERA